MRARDDVDFNFTLICQVNFGLTHLLVRHRAMR
jgi:hypothetical protein